jgi:hypothetical protein
MSISTQRFGAVALRAVRAATIWRLGLVLLVLASVGCAARPLEYRAFGPVDFERQRVVTAKYGELHDQKTVPAAKVEVFQQSFPAGIDYHDGVVKVEPGAPYEVLGEFALKYETQFLLPTDEEAVTDMRRVALAAGGDIVVCALKYKMPPHPYVLRAAGFVLHRLPSK